MSRRGVRAVAPGARARRPRRPLISAGDPPQTWPHRRGDRVRVHNGSGSRRPQTAARAGLPDVLIKGARDRRFREVEVRCDKDGNPVASVQVQQPRLRVTVLDLSDYQCHELASSTEPTEARTLGLFSVGDLLAWYGDGLLRGAARQVPVAALARPPGRQPGRDSPRPVPGDRSTRAEVIAAAAAGCARTALLGAGPDRHRQDHHGPVRACARRVAAPIVAAPPPCASGTGPDEVAAVWGPDALVPVRGQSRPVRLRRSRRPRPWPSCARGRQASATAWSALRGPARAVRESRWRCGSPIGVAPTNASRRATCK